MKDLCLHLNFFLFSENLLEILREVDDQVYSLLFKPLSIK